MANRGGFSWKRAVGITRAKQRVSRATGIPWTRSGRQRKLGRMVGCGCVVFPALSLLLVTVIALLIILL
jgi:hypothetical protein